MLQTTLHCLLLFIHQKQTSITLYSKPNNKTKPRTALNPQNQSLPHRNQRKVKKSTTHVTSVKLKSSAEASRASALVQSATQTDWLLVRSDPKSPIKCGAADPIYYSTGRTSKQRDDVVDEMFRKAIECFGERTTSGASPTPYRGVGHD